MALFCLGCSDTTSGSLFLANLNDKLDEQWTRWKWRRVPFIWSKTVSFKYHFNQIICIQKSTFGRPKFELYMAVYSHISIYNIQLTHKVHHTMSWLWKIINAKNHLNTHLRSIDINIYLYPLPWQKTAHHDKRLNSRYFGEFVDHFHTFCVLHFIVFH